MLINIYPSEENYGSFNTKCAKIFGLECAVYLQQLISILDKVIRKNKFIEETYFKIDRKYIKDRTTFDKIKQKNLELILKKLNIIQEKDDDVITLDLDLLTSILLEEDKDELKRLTQICKNNSKEVKDGEKREAIIVNLQASVVCSNDELLHKLQDWVEVCMRNKYLNAVTVRQFQNELNNYTQGDLDMALEIVDIAIERIYTQCQWAINLFERKHPQMVSYRKQQIATEQSIDKNNTY